MPASSKQSERRQRLMPNGIPRWVRIYDNGGKTADRYCCVYTGLYNNIGNKTFSRERQRPHYFRDMSVNPCHPQGVGLFGESSLVIDRLPGCWGGPSLGRLHPFLGRRIRFQDLPVECQRVVRDDYMSIWYLQDA